MKTALDETAVFTRSTSKRLSAPALRTFFRIADEWELNRDDQMALLGLASTSTYHNWKSKPASRLSQDTLERISYVFGIYKALQILFAEPALAHHWFHHANRAIPFAGRSPLTYLRNGKIQNLLEVRQYLDEQRGS